MRILASFDMVINLLLVISAYILAEGTRNGTKGEVLNDDKLREYKSCPSVKVVGGPGG
jgi:hypothetical protein